MHRGSVVPSVQLYDTIGTTYGLTRRTEPRIAAQVWAALGDARTANFYDGVPPTNSNGPARRLGHIPGAKSIPFNSLSDSTGRLKSATDLRAIFTKAGVQPGDTVVAYCHVGQQATAVLFAARTLGHPVKLFDGSWDEWNKRTEFPVEVPPKNP